MGTQLTILDALERGHAAAQRAAARAGDTWVSDAINVIDGYLSGYKRSRPDEEFTMEELRDHLGGLITAPPDLRAWGHVTREALRRGIITRVAGKYRAAKSSNGSPKPIYKAAA